MTKALALALVGSVALTAAAPAVAQTQSEETRFQQAQDRFDRELAAYRAEVDRYRDAARRNTGGTGYYDNRQGYNSGTQYDDNTYYDPSRDYRTGNYQERVLAENDRVYRGSDGRYYCRRQDGTVGLVVGAGLGAILGNVIDGGRSRVLGTILGGLGGGLAGRAVQQRQQDLRCR